jgi:SpoIID/LytB domain protein
VFAVAMIVATVGGARAADDMSGADKLRVVYSNQFAWSADGLPIVTIGIGEGLKEVTVGGATLLPDGEGGASVSGGKRWTVRAEKTRAAKKRWHVVVARLPSDPERVQAEMETWRGRGFSPARFEIGTVFAVRGSVFDSRRVLVTVAPADDEAAARKSAAELAAKFHVETALHPELVERPRGTLVATDERGTVVKNDAILWFRPDGSELLEVEKKKYAGRLYVTLDNAGQLAVVNAVPEDRLLAGLVPAEMSAGSPPEALKAQAVAARNELLAKIGTRHLTDPYRLCSSVHCQVYAGAGHEDARATAAVQATRGEFLLRDAKSEAGALVDAVYSASCGGHTEDNDKVWGGAADASLRGVTDAESAGASVDEKSLDAFLDQPPNAFCARAKEAGSAYRWQRTLDVAGIEAKAGVGRLRDLVVMSRGVSGRIAKLQLSGDGGAREITGELEVRRLLGAPKELLKSALVRLAVGKDASGHVTSLEARGGGHGHGIGMCQLGAVGMALAGKSYREILLHYYSASHLQRLY